MSDLSFEDLGPAQSDKQPNPPTIASAATIAPNTRFTFITGTVQVANITPPTTGYCELVLCFTNAAPGLFLTTGNILTAYQPIQNRPVTVYYDKPTNKWYVQTVA
jgi:hypothetical protein